MTGWMHLLRHGITEGNKKRWYYGVTDIPLVEEGAREILGLVEEGVYPMPQEADYYTSGLLRTEETFSLIYGNRAHKALTFLQEMNFGVFEGKSHEELEHNQDYIKWISEKSGDRRMPEGESPNIFTHRVLSGMENFLMSRSDAASQLIIVCHGGVIATIMHDYFPEVRNNFFEWIPEPARGFSVKMREGSPDSFLEL